MPFECDCPVCSKQVRVPDRLLGKDVRCPKCGTVFLVHDGSGFQEPTESVPEPAPSQPAPLECDCPACSKQIRVPDRLLGKNVRCPSCGHVFLVYDGRVPQAPAPSYPSQPSGNDDYDEDRPRRRRRRRFRSRSSDAAARVVAPGTCLLITGIICLLIQLVNVGQVLAAGGVEAYLRTDAKFEEAARKDPELKNTIVTMFTLWLVMATGGGILITAGAGCMLGRKLRGLAIAASIVAMLPCCSSCCLGIPFGIWCLVVLANADVRETFS